MNQLVYSADYENNMAYTYDYDADGNITAEYIYKDGATGPSSQTTINVYTYGDSNWKDKLTAYKGQAITYDQIGNPLTYRDGITMTWQNGRQLATLQQGNNSISYKYDSNSVRTSKNVNGVEHTYAYLNGKLMYETRGNSKFYYSYDANGTLYSVNYTLTDSSTMQTYYYTNNSQGDIIGIYDSTGTLVAKYTYGDWGNVLSVTDSNGNVITDSNHIGNLNPFRYRGYYYDSETGFYYLMSRYYDPVTHRFINADGLASTGMGEIGNNMSAYCNNNPIVLNDHTGMYPTYGGTFIGGGEFHNTPAHRLGFFGRQIETCYIDGEVIVVTKKQLKEIGFENVTSSMVNDLNNTMRKANINSNIKASHFIAQCASETNYGMWLTEIGDENYFANTEYGYKYRGAGYIQLTWDYNYAEFADYMGDPEIYNQGANYVAANYAWAAAGWFWTKNNINNVINGHNVDDVTAIVNYYTNTYADRRATYNHVYGILG